METVLEVIRAKISGYIKNQAALKIGLHTDLGNSRTEKASFKQELVELRSQLETERANREKIEAKLSELKENFVLAARLVEKLTPNATTIFSQLRASYKKSETDLVELEAI